MKTKHLTILFTLGLLAILGGAIILSSMGQTPLEASVKFNPRFIDFEGPAPMVWEAYIRAGDTADFPARDIDGSTIKFEDTVPSYGGYLYKGAYVAEFDGQSVFNIVLSQVGHMGVPPDVNPNRPVHYWFTVTGELKDGTPIEGEGWVAVSFPLGPPPPPPPPP